MVWFMPRASRHHIPNQVWHITHRCHQRDFLFKFAKDRKCWNYGDSLLNALIKLVSVMHDSTYFALFTNPVYVCL